MGWRNWPGRGPSAGQPRSSFSRATIFLPSLSAAACVPYSRNDLYSCPSNLTTHCQRPRAFRTAVSCVGFFLYDATCVHQFRPASPERNKNPGRAF